MEHIKKTLIGLLFVLTAATAGAQISQVWISMPDSLCPYLNTQQRKFMLDYALKGQYEQLPNQLKGVSRIDTLDVAGNTIRVQMTQVLTTEIHAGKDTITIVQTVCAPRCSSRITTYNYAWKRLSEYFEPWDAEQTEEEKQQWF